MLIEIYPPKPHTKTQLQIMKALNTPGLQEVWVAAGSKFGKSAAAGGAMVLAATSRDKGLFRWVAPIYKQTEIGMEYLRNILPGDPYTQVTRSGTPKIYFPSTKTRIEFWHGSDPYSLEGQAVNGYVLDECAKMKKEVYSAAVTTRTVTKGPFLCISTPLGKNWFYEKCMEAKIEMEADIKANRPPRKLFLTAPTSANPYVDKSVIDDARQKLPARLFEQYFLAKFTDNSTVFSGYEKCVFGDRLELEGVDFQEWISKDAEKKSVVIGVDWAKEQDYTVFFAIAIDKKPRCVGFSRFHKQDFISVMRRLIRFGKNFREVQTVWHDRTGLGSVMDDLLDKTNFVYHGVTFTNDSKSDMVNKLMVAFHNDLLEIPFWPEMIKELDSFEVDISALGKMRYNAPSGMHDDIISAMMLAWAAVLEYSDLSEEVRFLEEIELSPLDEYYSEDDDL
jgi:hypothetical protein